jgi:hypothetical protein
MKTVHPAVAGARIFGCLTPLSEALEGEPALRRPAKWTSGAEHE